MNRGQLIKAVAAHTAEDPKDVEKVIGAMTGVITAVVAKGEPVTIQGFAKFAKVERAARMGRNPRTGEQIRIKASKRVRVSAAKAFKDTVMTPSQAPKLARGVWPTDRALLAAQASERRAAAGTTTRATAAAAGATKTAAKRTAAKKTAATRSAAKRTVAKKTAATKTAATRSAAKRTVAKRTVKTAPRTAATRRPAATKTARKTTAKRIARR